MKKKIWIALAIAAIAGCNYWRSSQRKPITAAEAKEFEDSENMFPEPR